MNWHFILRMVRRESRGRRRLAVYMAAISLGVAALVAINGFRANLDQSVREQARGILGADLSLSSRRPLPDSIRAVLDTAEASGVSVSYVTTFASMAFVPTGQSPPRLVQVRAITGPYPYYGAVRTEPEEMWLTFRDGRRALVDPAVLIQLDASVGDTIRLGETSFEIAGVVTNVPGDVGIQTAIGPRVFIPAEYLEATGLLRYGSLARYQAYLEIPAAVELERFLIRNQALFQRHQVGFDTADDQQRELSSALDRLARFLGLVGLAALLLGGVGVASAVHVYVRERLDSVALLRCLGARQNTVFTLYLVQAAMLGALGAAVGAVLGLAVQASLPRVLGDFLPLDVTTSISWPAVATGFGIGIGVAVLFALLPLLQVRNVPPLRTLRRDTEPGRTAWTSRLLVLGALGLSIVGLSVWQAPRRDMGLAFALAIAVTVAVLWLTAVLLTYATRRFFPARARYVVRQGVANLFRPRNQTVAVTLALGFGVFLVGTLYVVQRNLVDQLSLDQSPNRPNLVMFDVQADQRDGVVSLLEEHDLPVLQTTPIITARIAALNGRSVDSLLADTGGWRRNRWALRREYRNTYRDTVVTSEVITAGRWWDAAADGLPRISMEQDIADDLGLAVGDRVTWDIQGVRIETQIASLRRVNWARFEPNFFVVFEPGPLDRAPQTFVVLTRGEDDRSRGFFQRDLVRAFPNVSAVDLTLLQRTVDTVLSRVTLAIRFMAMFSIAAGLVMLVGAIATSRFQRLRESVLLKTLGARASQVRGILITEYFALGILGGLAGVLLAAVAGYGAIVWMFQMPFRLPALPLTVFWLGTAVLTTVVGGLLGRDALRKPPLAMMREMSE